MNLRALSAGWQVANARFAGSVHSVFAHACNIELDDRRMLTLLTAEHANVPDGVRLDTPRGFAFDRLLRENDRVGCRAGVARFAEAELTVRLHGARYYRSRLDPLEVDLARAPVAAAWHQTRCALQQHAGSRTASVPGLPQPRCTALSQAVRARSLPAARDAVGHLIGCGAGLTPAGDDFVVGFLAGLRASAGRCAADQSFDDALGRHVRHAAAATNAISRAYLRHAADGNFAEPVLRLAHCIAAGADRTRVAATAGAALAVGATSGEDTVRGLLDALRCRH